MGSIGWLEGIPGALGGHRREAAGGVSYRGTVRHRGHGSSEAQGSCILVSGKSALLCPTPSTHCHFRSPNDLKWALKAFEKCQGH